MVVLRQRRRDGTLVELGMFGFGGGGAGKPLGDAGARGFRAGCFWSEGLLVGNLDA
jgi:hypothetical protein